MSEVSAVVCEHEAAIRTRRVCAHLLADIDEDHCQLFVDGQLCTTTLPS